VPDLDERLAASRSRLLEEIEQPALSSVAVRAIRLRQRCRAGRATAAALALAIVALIFRPWSTGTAAPQPAGPPDPGNSGQVVYTDAGVTINGLLAGHDITDLPGRLEDVEFSRPAHGWLLTSDCADGRPGCRLTVGETADGGLSWQLHPVPDRAAGPAAVPDLSALDERTLLLRSPQGSTAVSPDAGRTWRAASPGVGPANGIGPGDRLLLRPPAAGAGCGAAVVEVFSVRYGGPTALAAQPPIEACWVAAAPAADGSWWVGGAADGHPAAAVTRDRGASWQRIVFADADGQSVRVSTVGNDTYALVVAPDGDRTALRAIYHARAPGGFVRTWHGAGEPRTVAGEAVPTASGQLLLAGGDGAWFVSTSKGASFVRADELPRVGRLIGTPAGYVALDVVADGWAAYSADGSTWYKLHAH
jgi:hypothetical protein